MPGKRSAVVAPGGVATLPRHAAPLAPPPEIAPVIERIAEALKGEEPTDALFAVQEAHPDTFDIAYSWVVDDLARNSIHWFATRCFKFEDKPLKNRAVDRVMQSHIDECATEDLNCGILAPPGLGKTWQVSYIRALWWISKNPNIEVKVVSGADETAKKRIKAVAKTIMMDADYRRVFGHTVRPSPARARAADPYNDHRVTVDRTSQSLESTIEAFGVLSTAAGSRCHKLIFDDAIDEKSTLFSEAKKKQVAKAIGTTWITRPYPNHPDSQIIWICTMWDQTDQSSRFMRSDGWRFCVIRVSKDFKSLDVDYIQKNRIIRSENCPLPEGWTAEYLKKRRSEMTAADFDRMYRQMATSEDALVLPHVAQCWDQHIDPATIGARARAERWKCYVGVDISGKKRKGTAIVTIGLHPETGVRIPVDVRVGAWRAAHLAANLNDVWSRYNPVVVRVENNSVQDLFLDMARQDPGKYLFTKRMQPFTTTTAKKWSLENGIQAMDLEFEQRNWAFPASEGHDHEDVDHIGICGYCRLRRELRDMTPGGGGYGENDCAMAMWIARSGVEDFGPRHAEQVKQALSGLTDDPFLDSGLDGGSSWLND